MGKPTLQTDIAIIGGGIAGLWALNQLRDSGYNALLFEREALGSHQTIGSQGMIHGGIKYALDGVLNPGSEAVAAMPGRWRDCLEGHGSVNLRDCKVLSEALYLWSGDSIGARLSAFFTSRLLRGRIQVTQPTDYPEAFRHPQFRGQVYQMADLVLDVPSLVNTLAARHAEAIFKIDWSSAALDVAAGGTKLMLPGCNLEPECLLLTAGCGNEALIEALGGTAPLMQRRPLQQVLVKHPYATPLFAHCLGVGRSPRVTISSHPTRDGATVWYLGGDLATAGANEEPTQLINHARAELKALLPWIDLGGCEWRTIHLNRAEPRQGQLVRPNTAFVEPVAGVENVLAAWPTKLTLTPHLGDAVQALLHKRGIRPRHPRNQSLLTHLPRPPMATPYWETLF